MSTLIDVFDDAALPFAPVAPTRVYTDRDLLLKAVALLAGIGAGGGAGGGPASIADGSDVAEGAKANAAVTNPASAASVIALLKGLLASSQTSAALGDAQGSISALLLTPQGSNSSALQGVLSMMFNGTTWDRMRGSIAHGLAVDVKQSAVPGFSIPAYDYAAMTYVGSTNNVETIVYKTGGSGGTTVATLTFTYVASGVADDDDIATITKS